MLALLGKILLSIGLVFILLLFLAYIVSIYIGNDCYYEMKPWFAKRGYNMTIFNWVFLFTLMYKFNPEALKETSNERDRIRKKFPNLKINKDREDFWSSPGTGF